MDENIKNINRDKSLVIGKINTMIENGRLSITNIDELRSFPIGSIVSYMSKDGMFYPGGFLVYVGKKHFKLLPDLFGETKIIRININNIETMYVGNVYEITGDVVSIKQSTNKITKHLVKIGDVVVYYGRDKIDKNRYMATKKYQKMLKWYALFGQYYIEINEDSAN
jgi:hypothetical protein